LFEQVLFQQLPEDAHWDQQVSCLPPPVLPDQQLAHRTQYAILVGDDAPVAQAVYPSGCAHARKNHR